MRRMDHGRARRPTARASTPRPFTRRMLTAAAVGILAVTAACGGDKASTEKVEATLNDGLQAHVEGRLTEAAEKYNEVLKLDENNKFAIYNLALIDQTNGRPTDAELKYRKVLQLDPNYGPALFNLAIVRAGKGDPNEAISLYRRAIEAQPGNASAHLNLGLLLRANGQVDEGEAMIRKARELNPELEAPPR